MITKQFEITLKSTRGATTKLRLIIEAVDERNAELARAGFYTTAEGLNQLSRALRDLTAPMNEITE